MQQLLPAIFLIGSALAFGQSQAVDSDPTPPDDQTPTPQEKPRSTLEVKPGSPAIKQKDIWDQTGFFHPFVRMPKYILQDQKAIWTSPFHTAKSDIKWWLIFGTATGALIASDRHIVHQLSNSSTQISLSTWASRFGSAYFLVPASAGFYMIGTKTHDERFRETGLLCFETLIDVNLVAEAIKLAAARERPLQGDGAGHFQAADSRWSSSFPSGHAISSWSMASIVAHQYRHHKIVPIAVYALASTVIVARVGARQHFPGDVVAGSALGWFIGDFVYGKRHNAELDHKQTIPQKIASHVNLGME